MKRIVLACLISAPAFASSMTEKRCGWIVNPTPANYWLIDRHGEWTIGIQGGPQADGDVPGSLSPKDFVATNGNYGHYCACMTVEVDRKERRILRILDGKGLPLATCRTDKKLPKEPG